MNNTINLKLPIATTIEEHPEILPLLVELGFKPLANTAMRNSVGKIVSLHKGAGIIKVDIHTIIQELEWNGYEVIGGEDIDK